MIETIWLLVEISLWSGAATRIDQREFRTERACLDARIGPERGRVGVYSALDRSVVVCRRVMR